MAKANQKGNPASGKAAGDTPVKTYIANREINHDHDLYAQGDDIVLPLPQATALLAIDAISDPDAGEGDDASAQV